MQKPTRQQLTKAMLPAVMKRLKQYRQDLGLSQEQMAMQYGIAVRSYIDLEHGKNFPSATTFAQLLTALSKDDLKDLLAEIRTAVDPLYEAKGI